MRDDELCWLTASELAERIACRTISPVEVVDAHIARAERVGPKLNAFITLLADQARDAARQAESELVRGERRGPLHGVPIALKDLVYTRGVRTTVGSRIHADFFPGEDATLVERFRESGAIILAKAHTHEFAFGPTSNNPHYGPCRNPWDPRRIPGGSSGGSAAAVAAGLCPIAIGTDTGGSIRIPAALCGTMGLKPTYGRVSRHGVFPLSWSFDHAGPLTRTARDAALALGAIAGHDPRDPTTSRAPVGDYAAALTGDLRGVRLGVLREHQDGPLDDEVRALVGAAIARLEELGARIEEVSIPEVAGASDLFGSIVGAEAAAVHERGLRERYAEYGADVRQRLLPGFAVSGLDYVRAQQARTLLITRVRATLERFHALVGPTAPIPAPEIGQERVVVGGQEHVVRDYLASLTRLYNATGFPAISVPCGRTTAGLSVGLHIGGRPLDEATLVRVADAYERATAEQRGRPPLDDLP